MEKLTELKFLLTKAKKTWKLRMERKKPRPKRPNLRDLRYEV